MVINNALGELSVNMMDHGRLAQQQVNAFSTAFNTSAHVWEYILRDGDKVPIELERMRNTMAQQIVATPSVAPGTEVVPARRNRIAIVFSPPSGGTLTVSLREGVVTGGGVLLTTSSPPLVLNLADHGSIVNGSFFLAHSIGNVAVGVWEVFEL